MVHNYVLIIMQYLGVLKGHYNAAVNHSATLQLLHKHYVFYIFPLQAAAVYRFDTVNGD